MGYKLIGKNTLIPKIDVPGKKRSYVKDVNSTSVYSNTGLVIHEEDFIVTGCSIQPPTGRSLRDYTLKLGNEGYKDHDSYLVFCDIRLKDSLQGTGLLPDQVFLPDLHGLNKWFTVMKTDWYVSSQVERYQCFVVAVPGE